jgi:hypothetical protein
LNRWSATRTTGTWNSPGRVQAGGGDFCRQDSDAGVDCTSQGAAQGGSSGAREAAMGSSGSGRKPRGGFDAWWQWRAAAAQDLAKGSSDALLYAR